jgi:hypothetical protein
MSGFYETKHTFNETGTTAVLRCLKHSFAQHLDKGHEKAYSTEGILHRRNSVNYREI